MGTLFEDPVCGCLIVEDELNKFAVRAERDACKSWAKVVQELVVRVRGTLSVHDKSVSLSEVVGNRTGGSEWTFVENTFCVLPVEHVERGISGLGWVECWLGVHYDEQALSLITE